MLGESIVNDRDDRNDESGILEGMLDDPKWEHASVSLRIGDCLAGVEKRMSVLSASHLP